MTRKGTPCQAPAVWLKGDPGPRNGRCRNHGGLSIGPTTPEGCTAIVLRATGGALIPRGERAAFSKTPSRSRRPAPRFP
jgi:hypothetical protein